MPVTLRVTETHRLDHKLARVDAILRNRIVQQALRAGGNVVKKRLKEIIPRSANTGTREGWSKDTRQDRTRVKPHVETIGMVWRDYGHHFVVVVGAQYPAGALSHLIEKSHQHVAWGKPSGMVITGHDYTTRAGDGTTNEQRAVIESTVISEVEKLLK